MATDKQNKRYRTIRIFVWSIVLFVSATMLLPLTGYLYVGIVNAEVASADQEDTNPRSNFWRAVREGNAGYTTVRGQETNVLIQNGGESWRQWRNGPIITYGAIALGAVAGLLLIYMLLRGQVKLEGGNSGRTVERWSLFMRTLHWYTAILFIILAVTGLSLLFGRAVLIPAMGPEGFAAWAQTAKTIHDYLGPPFAAGVVLMLLLMLPYNLPERTDLKWLAKGGGLLGKGEHPHAGRINAGEKIFTYGSMLILGVVVCVSGLILDFPNYGQLRETMQLANVLHAAASVLWIAIMFGHIYLGLWGVEGTLKAMTRGRVDENWAKQHHDLWYEKVKGTATKEAPKTAKPVERTVQPS
jgi:formate dehydrogenase subunit gamma